jgi:hypothetical protein
LKLPRSTRGGWFAAACAVAACAIALLFGDEWRRVLLFFGIVAVAACGMPVKVRAHASRSEPPVEALGQRELAE